jgi:regulator of replication initiation timing
MFHSFSFYRFFLKVFIESALQEKQSLEQRLAAASAIAEKVAALATENEALKQRLAKVKQLATEKLQAERAQLLQERQVFEYFEHITISHAGWFFL